MLSMTYVIYPASQIRDIESRIAVSLVISFTQARGVNRVRRGFYVKGIDLVSRGSYVKRSRVRFMDLV